jgi:hypothetical protein
MPTMYQYSASKQCISAVCEYSKYEYVVYEYSRRGTVYEYSV